MPPVAEPRALRGAGGRGPALIGGLAALLLHLGSGAAPACVMPTRADIIIDGDIGDWSVVLLNPLNTTFDGDGSRVPCASSEDADCPISVPGNDVVRFAWTWDATAAYFLVEGAENGVLATRTFIFIDSDFDGRMQSGEFVASLQTMRGDADLQPYEADGGAGGDALADPSGSADGTTLPGGSGSNAHSLAVGQGRVPNEPIMEVAVPWALLGVPPGSPLGFHVSQGNGSSLPNAVEDNLGSAGDRAGTTGWRCLALAPDRSMGVAPGGTAVLAHRLENLGNVPARYLLALSSACAIPTEIWRDDTGDGQPDVLLARDSDGDGAFWSAADLLSTAGDPDADGRLDSGLLPAGATLDLVLVQVQPGPPTCANPSLVLQAADAADASVSAFVNDTIRLGSVTIAPPRSIVAAAGDAAWLPHVVTNSSGADLVVDLSALSGFSWPLTFFADPDRDGNPADATALADTNGNSLPDLVVPAGQSAAILARPMVPGGAGVGLTETVFVRAATGGTILDTVTDRVTVKPPLLLEPSWLADVGQARHGASGASVWFAHRLTNVRSTADTFSVTFDSPDGWPVSAFLDPDGDGRPFDAQPLPDPTSSVPGNGGKLNLLVRVDVPPGVLPPRSSRIGVTATATTAPQPTARVNDDAVAAIVVAYEDVGQVVALVESPPCADVHAGASGLPGLAGGHRWVWRDPAGVVTRQRDVTTDSTGRTQDSLPGATTDALGTWTVTLERFDGASWTALDTARFDVIDPITATPLVSRAPTHDLDGDVVGGSLELTNPNFLLVFPDLVVRFVVVSADGAVVLLQDGSTAPFAPGTSTAAVPVPQLRREEAGLLASFAVPAVTFPFAGTWRIEASLVHACGFERALSSTTFEVIDDADGDGLPGDVEIAQGTDPDDADSDDDGLADGEDGSGDADGDGGIDALDCDSDNDGLTDGLESGLTVPGPDTLLSAGCFVPDQDNLTTSDPDLADTDAGGMPDGLEDANGNGRLDAGETNLRDPSDDANPCAPERPPALTGLRGQKLTGNDVRWSWQPTPDPCAQYSLFTREGLPPWVPVATSLVTTSAVEALAAPAAGVRFYAVAAVNQHGQGDL